MSAVLPRGGGDLTHEEGKVAEVVGVGHRIGAAARGVRGEIQALVEHVVLERADPLLADEPVHLAELLGRHHAEVVPEIGVSMADGRGDDLGEDRPVGTALVQVVLARAEVAEHRGDTARQRGGRLAPGVGREIAVDADVKVRVYRARKHQLAAGVHDGVGVARCDRVDQRGDTPGSDADIAAQGPYVGKPPCHSERRYRSGAWRGSEERRAARSRQWALSAVEMTHTKSTISAATRTTVPMFSQSPIPLSIDSLRDEF